MDDVREGIAASYDPALAVSYGQFVNVAYQMYGSDPANPTPAPPASFPAGYRFFAWVQMKDFLIESSDWSFYGLMAQSTSDTGKFILAIRGTDNPTEWWDDLVSVVPAPRAGFGSVGYGFARIYQTLRLVDLMVAEARDARGVAQSPQQSLTFAQQVAAAVQRRAPTAERPGEREAAPPIGGGSGMALRQPACPEGTVGRSARVAVLPCHSDHSLPIYLRPQRSPVFLSWRQERPMRRL